MPEIRYNMIFFLFVILYSIFSEYKDRYVFHRPEVYSTLKNLTIPRIYSRALDRTLSFNKDTNYHSTSNPNSRPLTNSDPMETDFIHSLRRNALVPRAYSYLGTVSTNEIEDKIQNKLPSLTEAMNPMKPIAS